MAFALRRLACRPVALRSPAIQVARGVRAFSSANKLSKILEAEAKHEKDQYEEPPLVKDFVSKSPFKFSATAGDVNMVLSREQDGKKMTVDWQLTSPFGDDAMEENEQDDSAPPTDFTFSVESMSGDEGLIFYCSTSSGDGDRFVIGNVRQFSSKDEKDSNTAYNGPDFEDLDEKLQESFLEYLKDSGLTDELCDFIDATALDKEQVEYMRWLNNSQQFLAA
jgi:complement component 1 Q subcomponent-binding protein